MAGTLGKNLNFCFFTNKIKRPATTSSHPSSSSSVPEDGRSRPFHNSSSKASVLIKNFNCLYDLNNKTHHSSYSENDDVSSSESHDLPNAMPPDFSAVFASRRFFFSSPGRSNSIVESSPPTPSPSSRVVLHETLAGGSVAIPTYSPDPFLDFRRSMQEMVEARDHLIDVRNEWDYLNQLLTCYLSLNPKSTHKFIVGAFADLLVTLMASAATTTKATAAADSP